MGAELNLEDLVAPALVGPADQNFVLQTTSKGVADLAQIAIASATASAHVGSRSCPVEIQTVHSLMS